MSKILQQYLRKHAGSEKVKPAPSALQTAVESHLAEDTTMTDPGVYQPAQ